MSEEQVKNDTSVYTEATDEKQKGRTSRTVKVERSVSEVSDEVALESTTINEETRRGRKVTTSRDHTEARHDISSGTSITTEETERTDIRRKSGAPRIEIEETERSLYREDGALARTAGYDYEMTTFSSSSMKDKYNKKGRLKASESHAEVVSSSKTIKHDENFRFSFDGEREAEVGIGDPERYGVKKGMMAWAEASKYGVELEVENINRNMTFTGKINTNGYESYLTNKKGIGIEVSVNNEGSSGYRVDLSTGEKEGLSTNQLRRELKAARREADRVISRVTGGQINAVDEYMYGIKGAEGRGEKAPLGYVFDMTSSQLTVARQKTEEMKPEHDAKVAELKTITAEDVLKQKIMQEHSR